MTKRSGRLLPMVSSPTQVGGVGAASVATPGALVGEAATSAPPDRIAQGWTFRFVAEGPRADEMIELYESLGYEVAADLIEAGVTPGAPADTAPVASAGVGVGNTKEECEACQAFAVGRFTAIYTRRPPVGGRQQGERDDVDAPDTTAVLREEHQRILEVASALEKLLDVRPAPLDIDTVEKCVRFFRLFADACHHGKEEDLLFPELEARGMPRTSGPIAVMLHEHTVGREFVAAMAAALDAAREGDEVATSRLVNAGRGYIDLIRGHIMKEDHVLFNMADQMVDAPACERLCAAYDTVCAATFEGCTKAQLESLAEEILTTA